MEGDYEYFSIEDFVWDEDFRHWVLTRDAESELYWKSWLVANPGRKEEIETAADIVRSLKVNDYKPGKEEVAKNIDDIFLKINGKEGKAKKANPVFKWVVAAGIAGILFISILPFTRNSTRDLVSSQTNADSLVQLVNTGSEKKEFRLPEGSVVVLESQATLKISKHFGRSGNRTAYLLGSAFFNVAKDSSRPFYVYNDKMEVRVLGTAFKVHSRSPSEKKVEVLTGLVKVTYPFESQNPVNRQSVLISRNKQVTINEKGMNLGLVESPVLDKVKAVSFDYDVTSVSKIFNNLEEAYGIKVQFGNEVGKRTFSGNLTERNFMEKITIVCKAINCRFETTNGMITVTAGN